MKRIILIPLIILASCSNFHKNESELNKRESETVEITGESSGNSNVEYQTKTKDEFIPHAVKANRNKEIAIYVGPLEEGVFQAVGVLKWLERNGYVITKLYAGTNEKVFFEPVNLKKKTSQLEWNLHQCCEEDFPLDDKDSFLKILQKQTSKSALNSGIKNTEELNCHDFAQEFSQMTVLCINQANKDKVEFESQTTGMELIKINFAPVDYQEKLALVDYIDRGYSMAKKIKAR